MDDYVVFCLGAGIGMYGIGFAFGATIHSIKRFMELI